MSMLRHAAHAALNDSLGRCGLDTELRDGVLYLSYYNREGATYLHTIKLPEVTDDTYYASALCAPELIRQIFKADREADRVLNGNRFVVHSDA